MIFLSSSVRWLRSGRSGMFGVAVGGRGPPWGPTEADIFSTTTPPPPPAAPPRRVVSADRFPGAFPSHTSRHGPQAERQRQRQPQTVHAAHVRRHPRLCFCLSSLGVSPTTLSSSFPPTPRLPASALHRPDSRGAHVRFSHAGT
ncbi:hypothetical protein PBY51_020770 [Eleginops maclovinus]|uniref:Uncharacterized protein n=1 Tax=Eleginops maclovinus TaxID=56733 RepID=A0AAN7XV81_ELEMC|nr:hypothetical protein PBY51_020770 [Eleginops maclovinus]